MIQQLKAIYNGTRQPFSLCAGYMVLLCRWWWDTLSGTSPEHHLPDTVIARAVGKMVSSCSLANGLKCFACRLISLLLQTRFLFGCSSKLCSFYNYSWQLQMQAKILSGPAHSDLHRSLNTEEKWYMVNESEAHMLEVGDRNWCIHSFLLLYLS